METMLIISWSYTHWKQGTNVCISIMLYFCHQIIVYLFWLWLKNKMYFFFLSFFSFLFFFFCHITWWKTCCHDGIWDSPHSNILKVDMPIWTYIFFTFNWLTLTSEMHFVKFHPEVASCLLSRGKRKYAPLGMRLWWKYIIIFWYTN